MYNDNVVDSSYARQQKEYEATDAEYDSRTMWWVWVRNSKGRFEFCPEVTAKLLRQGTVIHELPVAYHPRTFTEGKKIRWTDGLQAVWTLVRYRFAD